MTAGADVGVAEEVVKWRGIDGRELPLESGGGDVARVIQYELMSRLK